MNFNAGPAALPETALARARDEMLDFAGTGMSVMEHSHRGKEYEAVHNEAKERLRRLMEVPGTHEILFVQGGASQQFAVIPMNWLGAGAAADYVVTGAWGEKALAEAKVVGALFGAKVHVAASTGEGEGKEKRYVRVATEVQETPGAAYVHFTSNETIHGVQYGLSAQTEIPRTDAALVCDMSSDFLWKKFDVSRYAIVYAGAQKNLGPSGVVVVLAHKDFLTRGRTDIPKIFQYRTHAEQNSLYNTPPTFGVYMVRNVLAWIEEQGGLGAIEQRNRRKAKHLYDALDAHPGFYRCPVEPASRSVMNVVWRLPTEDLENACVAEARKRGMVGLKGHRSVGGMRASLYNAVEPAWVEALAAFLREFAAARG
jgi:phosphoserine aminotransferase